MGITTALGNALSGMLAVQNSIDVVARNVANSGTPGYHLETVNVQSQANGSSNAALSTGIQRAFNQTLQTYYNNQISDSSSSSVQASYLNQLQSFIGQPGGTTTLDTALSNFQNALSAVATSPGDYITQATAVSSAQTLASTLNQLTSQVQGLRQQANGQIASDVQTVNQSLQSLVQVNNQLSNQNIDSGTRATLMDQRDQLVSQVAGMIDVNVTYRDNGTVALATRSGIGLLDQQASVLAFQPAGALSASSQYSSTPANNGVGSLTLTTPSGLTLDLVGQKALQSGELAGLVNLRDNTLVTAQSQLDQIAGALAKSMSTVETAGTAATSGSASGYSVDLSNVQPGNDVVLNYTQGGVAKSVKVVNVSDTSKLPMSYTDASGAKVIGLDFSAGAASVASALGTALGSGLSVSSPASNTLQVLNDGTTTTTISSLTAETTSTATQGAGLGLSLFVDSSNTAYTGSLNGIGQQVGFAGRISVNSSILANNNLLVQSTAGASLGDATRANYLVNQLSSMSFAGQTSATSGTGGLLNGNVSSLISQTMNYQGSVVSNAIAQNTSQSDAMTSLSQQMTTESGVDVNSQMAQLVQLQNAYSANARVMSTVQSLLTALMNAVQPG